jgi:hypothetical protein
MNPFEIAPLISNVPCKVESLASHADTIYVGTSDGQLLLYTTARSARPHLLTKASLGLGKKPVERVEVLGALGRVLALADSTVVLMNMYNLELVIGAAQAQERLPAWRACAAFCPQRGVPDYRLAVVAHAKGRKVVLYEYVGGDAAYEFRRELAVPPDACAGPVVAVEWHGRALALATAKKEVVVVDCESGRAACVVFPGVAAPTPAISSLSLSSSVRAAAQSSVVMRVVAEGTLIVGREGQGFVVDLREALAAASSGDSAATTPAVMAKQAMKWAGPPVEIAVVFPFVIALEGKALEVHYLSTQQVVQSIGLDKSAPTSAATHSSAAAPFTVLHEAGPKRALLACHGSSSSPACVYEMCVQPLEAQVREMLKAQRFADAIELYQYCSPAAADNDERVAAIHLDAAVILIGYLRFSEAFDHFALARADPRVPLAWFPDVAQPVAAKRMPGTEDIRTVISKSLGIDRNSQGVDEHILKAKRCLMDFLEQYRRQYAEKKTQREKLERTRLAKMQ